VGVELDPDNGRALYVPEGCAHGFQTLVDDTDVSYMISTPYAPHAADGVRWDDPTLAIEWPEVTGYRVISERDRSLPVYEPEPA
jgi:dTDP-4-dehydrorhamnose 3,5-epimerase